jgi:PEGA domain
VSRRPFVTLVFLCFYVSALLAKEQPVQVITWPPSGAPVVRISFAKFKEIGSVGNQKSYMIDTVAENLWGKRISQLGFSVHFYDKNKVRIGDGYIVLQDVGPGQSVKFQTTFAASGTPASLELVPASLPPELQGAKPPKIISITVNSIPQGAGVKLDGNDIGTTPKMVQVGVGKHLLEFSKEGFNSGKFPLEVGPDDVSGGSVSYELGTAVHDTLELRDGSVLTGDVESVSSTEVVLRMGGSMQHFNRNQVKRILFVERDPPAQ